MLARDAGMDMPALDPKSKEKTDRLSHLVGIIEQAQSFFGTSKNAVKSQIWIAVSVYVIVAIIRKRLNIDESLHTILQILSLTNFEKTPLNQLLDMTAQQIPPDTPSNQLNLEPLAKLSS